MMAYIDFVEIKENSFDYFFCFYFFSPIFMEMGRVNRCIVT